MYIAIAPDSGSQRRTSAWRASGFDPEARLAVVTGHAADNVWEAGYVQRARDFLDTIPKKFHSWEWGHPLTI
jgi:hypothetical protein